MEVKKPIKRNPAIVDFSKDHHFTLLLVWKIRQGIKKGVDVNRISKYVVHFYDFDIVYHFEEEEQFLFSRLTVDHPLRLQAESDHRDINQMIVDLRIKSDDEELLVRFADTLEKHIRFEERELFNYLQQNLSEVELTEIANSVKPRSHDADANWDDMFWERKS